MKKITFFLAALLLIIYVETQTPQPTGAVSKLQTAHMIGEHQQLAKGFQRLAGAVPKNWLPLTMQITVHCRPPQV